MVRQGWSRLSSQVVLISWFVGLLLAFAVHSTSHADETFDDRLILAREHAETMRRMFNETPNRKNIEWFDGERLPAIVLKFREKCGTIVDRNRDAINSVLRDFFSDLQMRHFLRHARLFADHMTLDELQSLSFTNPAAPSVFELLGDKRFEAYQQDMDRAFDSLKTGERRMLNTEVRQLMNEIDPCLGGVPLSLNRS